ncbi:MAG: helix-hairpin-helix domain-containing protein [Chitinophagaceae bacterium]|nr:helix-hairpin-helix domain-containing protein [Chitinophagaceae bacterium]
MKKSFYIKVLFVCFLLQYFYSAKAQETPTTPPIISEQQLENLTENSEDVETEDDSYLQEMQHFLDDPVNLNNANESDLKELKILTALQIQNLISYRNLFGNFINIYELQAIPGWNVSMIRKILPYITVTDKESLLTSLSNRLKNGENTILVRVTQVLEKSKGYLLDSSTAKSFYPGSPQKLFLRYKYAFKNLLQYGITAEKDAGEQFFKGAQKSGFDFYSAHFFVRNTGLIKSLALGDFQVNMGQGLTQWMGLAFKKSSDVLNIKRQAEVLRPYNSAGEIYFHRGAGITLIKKFLEVTAFVSYRKVDANFIVDTLNNEDFVSSLQTSGYHRTVNEVADKNSQRQITFGGNMSFNKNRFHAGVNGVHYNFKYPINKSDGLYNKYALSGNSWGNYSIHYSYTFKNIHFFGEAATTEKLDKAFINGLLINTDARVDMSFLYRKISRGYQSLYTNAFTESTFPTNESGFYAGISINPTDVWRVDAYADLYSFPWLRYRVDAPTTGNDYLLQVTYKPNKQTEIYSRYRSEKKAINYNPNGFVLNPVIIKPKQNWRTQLIYKVNAAFTFRTRIEIQWYDKRGNTPEQGFLTYADVIFKPLQKPYSGNIRLQYFETDSYNSRVYAYENDVLYSFSIPVYYDKGYRYYLNLNYDVSRKWAFWLRFAQTIYPDKKTIGSGLDEIKGNKKTELKLQSIINF